MSTSTPASQSTQTADALLRIEPTAAPGFPFLRALTEPEVFSAEAVGVRRPPSLDSSTAVSFSAPPTATTAAAVGAVDRKRDRSDEAGASTTGEGESRLFMLLDASVPTLQVGEGARTAVRTSFISAHVDDAPSLAALCRLPAAAAYYTGLYTTPEKVERDTRRRVDYGACRQLLRESQDCDDLEACVSCLTRGQHAHYAPLLCAGLYSSEGRRLRRPANTPRYPDATTVADLAEEEQRDFKLRLMYAVCSCPRCRWHPPPRKGGSTVGPPAAVAPAGDALADAEEDGLMVDTSAEAVPGATIAEAVPGATIAEAPAPTRAPAAAVVGDVAEPHEHLNYNFIDHAHVLPFVRRLRLHRSKRDICGFLRFAATLRGSHRPHEPVHMPAAVLQAHQGHPKQDAVEERDAKDVKSTAAADVPTTVPGALLVLRVTHEDFAARYRALEASALLAAPLGRAGQPGGPAMGPHAGTTVVASTVAAPGAPRAEQGAPAAAADTVVVAEAPPVARRIQLDYALLDHVVYPEGDAECAEGLASGLRGLPAPPLLLGEPAGVIPILALTRHALRDVCAAAAHVAHGAATAALFARVRGVALTLSKRACHALLSAHVNGERGEGKSGFRVPVRVYWRVASAGGADGGGGSSGPGGARGGDVTLHVELGHPFPRPLESRREAMTSAAKKLLRSQRAHALAEAVKSGGEGVRGPPLVADVTLTRSAAAVAATTAGTGAGGGLDTSASVSRLTFRVVASPSAVAPATGAPVFDMVKMDYLYSKDCGASCAAGQAGTLRSHGAWTTLLTTPAAGKAAGGDGSPAPTAVAAAPPSAPLLEAFSTTEALELSLLFHCFPAATVRVTHVNAYSGVVVHVDVLTRASWEPLLRRRLATVTAPVPRPVLDAHRARREAELVACAARLDGPGGADGEAGGLKSETGEGRGGGAREGVGQGSTSALDRQVFTTRNTFADPRNRLLFLPLRDDTTNAALESVLDVRYAWDSFLDLLASFSQQVVVAAATHLCTAAAPVPLDVGGELAMFLVKNNTSPATLRRAKVDPQYHASTSKLQLHLWEPEGLYPGLELKHDPVEEATSGVFLEKASAAVCEREHRGLREWPHEGRIPMTFRPREVRPG